VIRKYLYINHAISRKKRVKLFWLSLYYITRSEKVGEKKKRKRNPNFLKNIKKKKS